MQKDLNNTPPSTLNKESKRDISLDAGAGMMMIVTVFHHSGLLQSSPLSLMHIFNFFMPWFFFKAGMYYKKQKIGTAVCKKYFKRYIIPAFFCIGIKIIEEIAYLYLRGGNEDGFHWYPAILWFIEALLLCRIIFDLLPEKSVYYVIAVVSFIIADLINRYEPSLPLILKEVPMGLFYMSMGYLLKDIQYVKDKIIIVAMFFLYILFLTVIPSKVDMRMERIIFGLFEVAVIGNIVGIVLLNNLTKICESYIPRFLAYIGKESMSYYILHMSIMGAASVALDLCGINGNVSLFIKAIVVFLTVPVVIKIMEKLRVGWLLGR